MADKSKSVQSSSIQRFGSRLRFGFLGTLALVGAVSFLSPLAAGIITTALAAGFVAHEVVAPSWTKGGRWLKNVLHGNKTTVTAPGSGKPISVSQGQPTGNSLVDALVGQLRKSGLSVSTDWDAGKKVLAGLPDSYELFKKPDSKVYGFVYQGNIFINPTETSADVPIHEYTHLWAEALRQQNAEEWKNIVQMMKQDVDLWQQVQSTYTHLTTDDEIADEVLATYPDYRVFGDIGCYTLGALPPFKALSSCVDMGASITMAKGAADAGLFPAVAIIGDSTFTHSGMTGLLDAVNDKSNITVVISDNLTTGMTGGQDSAGTNKFEAICLGLGVEPEHVRVVVPLPKNMPEITRILKEEIEYNGVSVIIPRRECIQTAARHARERQKAKEANK